MNTEKYTQAYLAVMRKCVVLDIETIPNPDMVKLLPEPKIDSRLKDPVKVAQAKVDAKDEQLDKMALSPLTGKVACVGWYNEDMDVAHCIDPEAPESEKEMLDQLYVAMKEYILITYNGLAFDIPFIFKRGIMLGCEWATIPEMKRYTDKYKSADTHIDLMVEFCNYNQYEKLDTLARFILGDTKEEFDVTTIALLLKTPEGRAKVSDYCRKDCKITWELAKRMGFVKGKPKITVTEQGISNGGVIEASN